MKKQLEQICIKISLIIHEGYFHAYYEIGKDTPHMKSRVALETYLVIIINIWIAIVVAGYRWDLSVLERLGAVSGSMPTLQAWVELIPVSESQALSLLESYPVLNNSVTGIPLILMRTLNASFLHFSWNHLFGNIISLWVIGRRYENANYRGTFLIVYVVTGIISMTCSAVFQPLALTAGASGAVFGLMGASVVLSKRSTYLVRKGQINQSSHMHYNLLGSTIGVFLVYNLIGTFVIPGVSIVAHVSGMIAGLLIGLVLPIRPW